MTYSRREFVWTMGTAAAAYGIGQGAGIFWAPDPGDDPGWAPGLETRPASTCLICPARCGIRARVVDGRLVGLTGNSLHPVSQGGLCPRGVGGIQVLYHPERLATPVERSGPRGSGEWRALGRDRALDTITDHLAESRAAGSPEATALLSGHCPGSMQEMLRQFLRAYGSPNYVADAYHDGVGGVMELMHGIPRQPGYDLDRSSLVLSFGAPLFESWWSPLQAYVAFAGEARPNFVQIDTRFSRTAAWARDWVGVRPGTYGILALGMAYVLIRDELFDAAFIDDHVTGFWESSTGSGGGEGFRSLVLRRFRTEEVSRATGVPVERIASLARAFAASPRPIAIPGSDVTHGPDGFLSTLAVHCLNVLAGSVNRPGGVLFGRDPPLRPLPPVLLDPVAERGLAVPPASGPEPPLGAGDQAIRFARAVASGETAIQTLLLYYADPLASSVDPDLWRAALEKIPFVVSFSPFLDETTEQADLVVPDLTPYERWQDAPAGASYPYPVWGIAQPVVEPPSEGVHTGDAILHVARALGGSVQQSLPYENFLILLRDRARGLFEARTGMLFADAFERRHHRQMEERGWWLREKADFDSFWSELVERGGWMDPLFDDTDPAGLTRTPGGRIDLTPGALHPDPGSREGAVEYFRFDGHEVTGTPDYPLRLLPYRVSTLASGTLALERWMAEVPSVFPEVLWHPWVEVSPRTARELELEDGTPVWVISAHGRIRVVTKVFPGTAPNHVCVPYRVPNHDGSPSNPLQLLGDEHDSWTGIPVWSSTFVRLERA